MKNLRLIFLVSLMGAIASPKLANAVTLKNVPQPSGENPQSLGQNTNFVLQLLEAPVVQLSKQNLTKCQKLGNLVCNDALVAPNSRFTEESVKKQNLLNGLSDKEYSPVIFVYNARNYANLEDTLTASRDTSFPISINTQRDWGLGTGDWGLGTGDWGLVEENNPPSPRTRDWGLVDEKISQSPIPNPQSPIPNPQSPIPNPQSPIKIVTPTPGEVLDVPAATITVQFPNGAQVELRVNGELVDAKLIGRIETDASTGITTQTWYGVPLKEGENAIALTDASSSPSEVKIIVRGAPTGLKVETVEARIPADARSTATIKGELIDDRGVRSNRDAVVTLAASSGKFVSTDADPDQPGFQVKATAGQFEAKLQSSLQAGNVRIRAAMPNPNANPEIPDAQVEAFAQLQFETNLRPSLATGVIDVRLGRRGTDYWGNFEDFMPDNRDKGYNLDVKGGAFATGAIGNWLFTGAFNSARTLNQSCDGYDRRLFRDTQFLEQNYPTYGDNCTREVVTPSRDSLYLRFERSPLTEGAEPDYVMWGDFTMGEFARSSQQFTAVTRNLQGFKGNYNLGNFQVTGFFSPDVEGFQRDTVIPDGTSGFYFLSRRLIIPGSEDVFLEVEELDRPGTVVYRQSLSRGTDYEIDYDRGTLLFRRPILRLEVDPSGTVLSRRIVSTYQFDSQGGGTSIFGGRVQYNLLRDFNNPSWLGATYVRQDQGVRGFELYGADALISFGDRGELIAEYAHSTNDSEFLGSVSGNAYRLEFNGRLIRNILSGRAYFRSTDTGFSNDATTSFVPGQMRYGALLQANVTDSTQLRVSYDFERNIGVAPRPLNSFSDLFEPRFEPVPGSQVDNSLRTLSAGILQRIGKDVTTEIDFINRHREDNRPTNPLSATSNQLRSRLTYRLAENLTFRAQNELNLSKQEDIVYPDRSILALDWTAMPGITVRLSHIFFTGGQYESNSITSLDFLGDYKLGEDTALTGRFGIVNAQAMTGAVGIRQGWTILPGLRLDGTYEHIFGDLFGRNGTGVQYAQPYAYGQGASALGIRGGDSYSIGLQYTGSEDFQASARFERRTSSGGSNTVIAAAANGKLSPALTALVRYNQASSSNQLLEELGDTINLRMGLAYRDPTSDKFNALLRYEYRSNPSIIPDTLLFGSGTGSNDHTFALEAIYAPNWRWEFYGKAALRNSTSYLSDDFVGSGTVTLTQLRTTYRLGYQWDLVGEARWIAQPADDYNETGFVLEGGYYLTPNLRLSAGYVFGEVSDRDFDGSRNASGVYAGLTVKLNELFSGFGLQKPLPAPPKEENVEAGLAENPAILQTTFVQNPPLTHSMLSIAGGGEKKWK